MPPTPPLRSHRNTTHEESAIFSPLSPARSPAWITVSFNFRHPLRFVNKTTPPVIPAAAEQPHLSLSRRQQKNDIRKFSANCILFHLQNQVSDAEKISLSFLHFPESKTLFECVPIPIHRIIRHKSETARHNGRIALTAIHHVFFPVFSFFSN